MSRVDLHLVSLVSVIATAVFHMILLTVSLTVIIAILIAILALLLKFSSLFVTTIWTVLSILAVKVIAPTAPAIIIIHLGSKTLKILLSCHRKLLPVSNRDELMVPQKLVFSAHRNAARFVAVTLVLLK